MLEHARAQESQDALAEPDHRKMFQDELAPSYVEELRSLMSVAAPACVQLLGTMLIITTNQALVGHLGPKELAAASIACTVCVLDSEPPGASPASCAKIDHTASSPHDRMASSTCCKHGPCRYARTLHAGPLQVRCMLHHQAPF